MNRRKRKHEGKNMSMMLTEEEHQSACVLKAVVENCDDIERLSDFEYVQHTMASCGDIEVALERIRQLQACRKEYGIENNLLDALDVIITFMDQYPGVFLKVDRRPSDQGEGYFLVMDLSAMTRYTALAKPGSVCWSNVAGAFYYLCQSLFPNFHAIRNGCTYILEGADMEFDGSFAICSAKIWHDLFSVYPMHCQDSWVYNTDATTALSLTSLCQVVLGHDMMQRIYLGRKLQVNDQYLKLNDLYEQPSKQEAEDIFLNDVERILSERFRNEESFSL